MFILVPTYLTSKSVVFKLLDSRPNFFTISTFLRPISALLAKKKGSNCLLSIALNN